MINYLSFYLNTSNVARSIEYVDYKVISHQRDPRLARVVQIPDIKIIIFEKFGVHYIQTYSKGEHSTIVRIVYLIYLLIF
jgi:hypothetical protein